MKLTRRKFFRGLLAVPVGAGAAVVVAKLPAPPPKTLGTTVHYPAQTIRHGLPASQWRKLYQADTIYILRDTDPIMTKLDWSGDDG